MPQDMSPLKELNSSRQSWVLIGLLFSVTSIIYLQTYFFRYINLDDPEYILNNPLIRDFNIFYLLDFRTLIASDWTPLVTLSHAIEYKLWGFFPGGLHLVSALIHCMNAVLLHYLLRSMNFNRSVSILVPLIFAAHPLQVESVAWLSSRKNLLSTFFGLSYLLLIKKDKLPPAFLSLLLALASKGTSVFFPILGFAIILIDDKSSVRSLRYTVLISVSFLAAFLRGSLSVLAQGEVIQGRQIAGMDFFDRMAVMGKVLLYQCSQFFLPTDLSILYLWDRAAWSETNVLLSWLCIISLACWALYLSKRNRHLQFGILLFAASLFPTFNIVTGPAFQADRYFYLPLAGLSIVVLELGFNIVPKWSKQIFLTGVVFILIQTAFAFHYVAFYRNSGEFWSHAIEQHSYYPFAFFHRGVYRAQNGMLDAAEQDLLQTLSLQPEHIEAHYNLAEINYRRGRYAKAIENLENLLLINADVKVYPLYVKNVNAAGMTERGKAFMQYLLKKNPDNKYAQAALPHIGQEK